jgi:subtilisin family serine protease
MIRTHSNSSSPLVVLVVALIATIAWPLVAGSQTTDGFTDGFSYRGERVPLERVPQHFVVRPAEDGTAGRLADELGLEARDVDVLPIGLAIVRSPGGDRDGLRRLRGTPGVLSAQPLYRYEGRDHLLTGTFFVGTDDAETAARAALRAGANLVEELPLQPGVFKLEIPAGADLDVLDAVESARQVAGVRFAEPLFYWNAGLYTPNDPYYPEQWDMENTASNEGTPDADIDANEAWDITRGDPAVTIAIVDEGVDVDHEDLAGNMLPGFDSTDQAPPEGQPGNADCGDGHGTSCAGIAAAVGDNGIGTSGVAPECKILPVRIARGSVWTTNEWSSNGLIWAYQNGADVLSNSWGGGAPNELVSGAIEDATSLGRNGLGSVVCFATGNSDGPVFFPAFHQEVVAVGATSPCDERKSPTSCDGENFWGSCYGVPLDVVVPGVKIRTSDIMGSCGYTSGNYITSFNGTSSACPHAAGVAALVISANPNLTADQVQKILELTAEDEVGRASEDKPGWDKYMGWGRLNARAAVELAQTIDAPSLTSVAPGEGKIRSITTVTIEGDQFYGDVAVRVGGKDAVSVTVVDPNTLTVALPQGEVLGPVDVEVETLFGIDTLVGGYTYNPSLLLLGSPNLGSGVDFAVAGPPLANWGLVLDLVLGPREKKGVVWDIAFSPDFEILVNSFQGLDSPLNGIGNGQVPYTIPDGPEWIGVNLYLQAGFDGNGPETGLALTLSDLLTVTILP